MQDVNVAIIFLRTSDEKAVVLGDREPQELIFDPREVRLRFAVMNVMLDTVRKDCLLAILRDLDLQMRFVLRDPSVCNGHFLRWLEDIEYLDRGHSIYLTGARKFESMLRIGISRQMHV